MKTTLRLFAIVLVAFGLSGCFDVQQQVNVAKSGEITVTMQAQVERKGWDMLSADQQLEYLCGEAHTREKGNLTITGYGVTEVQFQKCFYEIKIPNAQSIPADFPLQLKPDGDLLEITMGTLLTPSGEPLNDIQRMAFAGHSWTVSVIGDIHKTTGQMTEDGSSTYEVVPLVDVFQSKNPVGIRAWVAPQ